MICELKVGGTNMMMGLFVKDDAIIANGEKFWLFRDFYGEWGISIWEVKRKFWVWREKRKSLEQTMLMSLGNLGRKTDNSNKKVIIIDKNLCPSLLTPLQTQSGHKVPLPLSPVHVFSNPFLRAFSSPQSRRDIVASVVRDWKFTGIRDRDLLIQFIGGVFPAKIFIIICSITNIDHILTKVYSISKL
jgi:hypothetical protein